MKQVVYDDMEEFYTDNPDRRFSGEADYGVHWRAHGWEYAFHVSYVRATGEIYAVHTGGRATDRGIIYGPVFVLGVVPPDSTEADPLGIYYWTLNDILDGWPAHCGRNGGLSWVIKKLRDYVPNNTTIDSFGCDRLP